MQLPLTLIEWFYSCVPFLRRPYFLAAVVPEGPSSSELQPGVVFIEKRGEYLKWAHFPCPKCGDHIQLPLAGGERWSLNIDILCRPSLDPSVWERRGCGAHFFIKKGEVFWCL